VNQGKQIYIITLDFLLRIDTSRKKLMLALNKKKKIHRTSLSPARVEYKKEKKTETTTGMYMWRMSTVTDTL